jgi:uncharacterized protein YndB with AHSA1/START domain
MTETTLASVVKTITVRAGVEKAFRVFTEGMDTWWPKTHHIGKAPMRKAVVEGRVGGRIFSEQTDDTQCDWGEVLAWDPPRRFVMAWKIKPNWEYEQDVEKASEVEVTFTEEAPGLTRVVLEHKHFERHGAGSDAMRAAVGGDGGWSGLMTRFGEQVEKA